MPDEPNPFEPWRPRSSRDNTPGRIPDEDLLRPWGASRRDDEDHDADEPEWYRQQRAPEPAWSPRIDRPRGTGAAFIWLTILLLLAIAVVWAANGGNHFPRVAAAGMTLWIGLLIAMVIGRNRDWRWYNRLLALGGGVAVCVLSWVFVPTTGGVNLWTAETTLMALRDLPAGDAAGFKSLAPNRAAVAREFRRSRNDLRLAEWRWFDRTINNEISMATGSRNPTDTLARLRATRTALPAGDFQLQQLLNRLNQVRQRVLTTVLDENDRECRELIRQKQYATVAARLARFQIEHGNEARELQIEGDLNARIHALRESAFRQHLEDARLTLENLLREEKYAAVAVEGKRLMAELLPEAQILAQQAVVKERLGGIRTKALTARLAQATEALNAMVKRGDFDQIPGQVRKAEEELAAENAELGDMLSLATAFTAAREAALGHRADRVRKTLDELFRKKEYAAVAIRAEELIKDLEPEGQAIGRTGWREGITEVRRKALQARFDMVRAQVQEQLKDKRYTALGETAEKAYSELGLEAEAVGLRGELVKFRDVCRFFARLAKDADEK